MSSQKKIIAVLGATGTQGGGVLRDLLKDGEFAVRAVTRNPDSDASKELKSQGAEVVKGDTSNTASLTEAFKGVYGVFGITDFWGIFFRNNYDQAKSEAEETQQGKNVVDAAKAAGVKHFVWSTLEAIPNMHCYHFDSKANVNPYLEASGVPYTHIYTSFYYNNLVMTGMEMLKPQEGGSFVLYIPIPSDTKMHTFAGSDVGRWAVPAFKNPDKYTGKSLHAVAEFISPREFRDIIERTTGKKIILPEVTLEEFNTEEYRQKITDEFWTNMNGWVTKGIKRDLDLSYSVAPDPITLEKFLKTDPKVRKYLGLD